MGILLTHGGSGEHPWSPPPSPFSECHPRSGGVPATAPTPPGDLWRGELVLLGPCCSASGRVPLAPRSLNAETKEPPPCGPAPSQCSQCPPAPNPSLSGLQASPALLQGGSSPEVGRGCLYIVFISVCLSVPQKLLSVRAPAVPPLRSLNPFSGDCHCVFVTPARCLSPLPGAPGLISSWGGVDRTFLCDQNPPGSTFPTLDQGSGAVPGVLP